VRSTCTSRSEAQWRCEKIAHAACTRCTETIKMKNKEEMVLLLRVIHACRRRQGAAAEMHIRGMVHRRDMAHRA
jgi:hypothetical protein